MYYVPLDLSRYRDIYIYKDKEMKKGGGVLNIGEHIGKLRTSHPTGVPHVYKRNCFIIWKTELL